MSCSTTISECLPLSVRNSSAVRTVSSSVMPATARPAAAAWVLHQQHADLQPLLLAVTEQAGLARDAGRQVNGVQHLGDAVLVRRSA
jgi:hypothetical protein